MVLEYQSPTSEWAIISILTLLFLLLIWKKFITKNTIPKLPPGPWRLPLIGSMHHLIGGLPHQKMRDLSKKYGPIMHLQLGELTNIIISSPEAAEKVLKTHDLIFAQRPQMSAVKSISYNYQNLTFSPYGDYSRLLRKIVTTELLSSKRVQSFRSIREEETSKLIESIASIDPGSAVDISRMITSLNYCIISRAVYGKILDGEDIFTTSSKKILSEVGRGISVADAYPSIKWLQLLDRTTIRVDKIQKQLDGAIQTILNHHRSARKELLAHHKEDLVDVLLSLQEKGDLQFPLTDHTIKALISDMFSGGIDTSVTIIEWAMSELMKNPIIKEKTQAEVREKCNSKGGVEETDLQELSYLKMVVKETFRLHPVVPLLIPRECMENCVIDGYDIPLKSKIMINTWAMGRDPKYWEDSEEFKPERFIDSSIDFKGNNNFEFLPFGAGRRSCPGILFGLANVELSLAKLLFHFDWKLANGIKPENLDMTEEHGITTKRKFNLNIIPTPYLPPIT